MSVYVQGNTIIFQTSGFNRIQDRSIEFETKEYKKQNPFFAELTDPSGWQAAVRTIFSNAISEYRCPGRPALLEFESCCPFFLQWINLQFWIGFLILAKYIFEDALLGLR